MMDVAVPSDPDPQHGPGGGVMGRPKLWPRLAALGRAVPSAFGAVRTEQAARRPLPLREVVAQGYRVRLDLSRQVLGIDVAEDTNFDDCQDRVVPIAPTLPAS